MGLIQNTEKLSPNQLLGIELLSSGKAITDVAASLEISRTALYKWLDNEEFNKALNKAIDKKTSLLFLQGLSQMEEILLFSPSNKERLQAFDIISRLADRYKNKSEITVIAEPKKELSLDELLTELKDI